MHMLQLLCETFKIIERSNYVLKAFDVVQNSFDVGWYFVQSHCTSNYKYKETLGI